MVMKKILSALLFSVCFDLAGEVFFVPGWRTGFDAREGSVLRLQQAYPQEKITVKSWDSLQPWDVALDNADEYTDVLLAEILEMSEEERRELILTGHSVGARIIADIAGELAARELKIHSVVLLAAPIPSGDACIGNILKIVRYYCCNIYNSGDWVLKYLYPADGCFDALLGVYGWHGADERYFEAEAVSDRFGFFNHYAYIYLDEFVKLKASLPHFYPDISVMQDEENIQRIPADHIFWETVDTCRNWQLQRHRSGKRFRITDNLGIRRASGGEKRMREAFQDIADQLSAAE